MKRLISIIILIFVFYNLGQSARVISSFDIARWYLDGDVVLICSVNHNDTLTVEKYDSLLTDGFHLCYNIYREQYRISIDSIIKGDQNIAGAINTIFTPKLSTQARKEKSEFTGLDSKGDSTFINTVEYNGDFYSDDSYFRIESSEKRLVILRKKEIGYVIDYQSKCDSITLNLIQEVERQGEDFFNLLSAENLKSESFRVYPNPFFDTIEIEGIQTKRIEITDIDGNTNKIKMNDPNHVDLSYLNPGVYVISIYTNTKKWTQKIVKK